MSSATDRTLTSAQSFLVGALPPNVAGISNGASLPLGPGGGFQPVPIYSTPSENDWVLRAYADEKCPAFLNNLQAFYESAVFAAKAEETKQLLSDINTALKTSYTLKDMFNIFDEQNVKRSYGSGTPAGGADTPLLDTATYAKVVDAANWLEWNRYANHTQAQNLCGGGLLADIVKKIDNGAAALLAVPTPVSAGPTFVEYSAHYPTMFCLLSAINISPDANQYLQHIPAYGAVIAIEVTTAADQKLRLQFNFQDGPGAPYTPITLPCSASAADPSCDYHDFKGMTAVAGFTKAGDWCTACGNVTMPACLAAQAPLLNSTIQALQRKKGGDGNHGVPEWSLALGTIGGAILGALVGAVAILAVQKRPFVQMDVATTSL